MPTPKSDFLSWDDDLDLDELLGEYTDYCVDDSDSEFEAERSEKPQETPIELTGYMCPHCNKCLKTISGFRGHVTKQHNDSHTKASDCKAGMTVPPTASKSKPSISVTVEDFAESFRSCLNKIESDSMSTLIPGMLDVCAAARQSEEVEDYFYTKFSGIVVDCNVSKSSEAVAMFTKLHKFRLDEISHRDLYAMLPGCSEESIMDFCQMFSLEIIGEIARVRLEKEKKQTNMDIYF